jgi:hypothetical protein
MLYFFEGSLFDAASPSAVLPVFAQPAAIMTSAQDKRAAAVLIDFFTIIFISP